jgi:hypothetical protein
MLARMKTFLELGKWSALGLAAIGIVISLVVYQADARKINHWSHSVAVVDRLEEIEIDDLQLYAPVVRYRVDQGELEYQFTSGSNPPKYQVGERLEICINPSNPREIIMKSDGGYEIIFIINGVILMIIAGTCHFALKNISRSACRKDQDMGPDNG